jgi:molecular chaperone DnaK (HSP70)
VGGAVIRRGRSVAGVNPTLLVVDYGAETTVALLQLPEGGIRTLEHAMLSAVFLMDDGQLETGWQAARRVDRTRLAPHPKLVVGGALDDSAVHLPVVDLVAATLGAIRERATGIAPVDRLVLTVPAAWDASRRRVLGDAAAAAGLPEPEMIPRPLAAATFFAELLGHPVEPGQCVLTYHLGAATFEAAVVRRTGDGFEIVSTRSGPIGGIHLDQLVAQEFAHELLPPGHPYATDPARVQESARNARETLSALERLEPYWDKAEPLNRTMVERVTRPALQETVALSRAAVRDAGLDEADLVGCFLAGGTTVTPLVATMLEEAIGRAPVVLREPRYAVPFGAMHLAAAVRDEADGPDLTFANSLHSIMRPSGRIFSSYYVTVSPPEEVIRWYRGRLTDHVEKDDGEWHREELHNGIRSIHRVVVSSVDDPKKRPGPRVPISDHYRTLVLDEHAQGLQLERRSSS